MNTVLSCVKLAYQINCMPMQINPQANKHPQLIPRQYIGKQRQRQRAVETGGDFVKKEKMRESVCVCGKSGRGEISFYKCICISSTELQAGHMEIRYFKILFAL